MKINPNQLDIKWMDFTLYQTQINDFRHSVYVEEQGLHQDVIDAKGDETGLHLGAFYQGELVSIISAFFIDSHSCEFEHFKTELLKRSVLRFGMRMEKKNIRGSGLSELLCIHMGLSSFETVRPASTLFICLNRIEDWRNSTLLGLSDPMTPLMMPVF